MLRKRPLRIAVAMVASILYLFSLIAPEANAFTTTGCKWGTTSPTISTQNVSGIYITPFANARNDINSLTPVTLNTTADGAFWWAWNGKYGATGWEGLATWTCSSGKVTGANSKLNDYYLASAPSARIKVVWLHELSHVFGLGHVTTVTRVMYSSASTAYNNGVRTLTADETNGYNYLY